MSPLIYIWYVSLSNDAPNTASQIVIHNIK